MNFGVSENEGVRRLLQKSNFNCDKFLQSTIKSGDKEISRTLNLLTQWSDNASSELKKIIYENSALFIDVGKAICQLETNMHFINHDLIEQKRILNELSELKLVADNKSEVPNINDSAAETNKEYLSILEKIEGVTHLLNPERSVVFLSDLQELNNQNFSVQSSVKLILMTDLLLVAKKYPHSLGDMTYRLVCSYELSNVAVVNVSERDVVSATNVFKIIAFPDIRLFKAETSRLKVDWVQYIENQLHHKHSPLRSDNEDASASSSAPVSDFTNLQQVESVQDWLLELPDDLDVAIAERDLETAVKLVERARNYLETNTNDSFERARSDLAAKVEFRANTLTETLSDELAAGSGRRGGLRSVRGAVLLLNRLGKRGLACELFLNNRSAVLDQRASQVAREGSQVVYANRLSLTFHRAIVETCYEFKATVGQFQSKLSYWCNMEMRKFAEQLRILLVESKAVPFLGLCSIMGRVRMHARAVGENIGANLEAAFEVGLMDCWEKLSVEHAKVLRDALDHRAVDEQWHPKKFSGQKDKDLFIREMQEAGIDMRGFCNGLNVTLTTNTCILSRSICLFTEGLRRLGCTQLSIIFQELVAGILAAELRHYERCLNSNTCFISQRSFILDNLMFLSTVIIPKFENCLSQLEELLPDSKLYQLAKDYQICLNNYQSMKV